MKQRFPSWQRCVVSNWRKALLVAPLTCACEQAAFADGTGSLDSFVGPLKNGLNLIMVFGFIAGCCQKSLVLLVAMWSKEYHQERRVARVSYKH